MTTPDWPMWAWVASFWVILPLACVGYVLARRARALVLPLVMPAALSVALALVSYGDPRYHASRGSGSARPRRGHDRAVRATLATDPGFAQPVVDVGRCIAPGGVSAPVPDGDPRRDPFLFADVGAHPARRAPAPMGGHYSGPMAPKVVILCGGLGTRLREETEYRPKPMVEIGGRPVLWHVMKLFAHHGMTEFVLCAGYRGQMIKDYFLNYEARNSDLTITLGDHESVRFHRSHLETGWEVTVADTGELTQTGGRVKRIERYLDGGTFLVTYGDGLADVDLGALLACHRSHGKLATVTTTRPLSRFGIVDVGADSGVERFREKPQADDWVSSGFFVFEPAVLDRLDPDCVLEQEPLEHWPRPASSWRTGTTATGNRWTPTASS